MWLISYNLQNSFENKKLSFQIQSLFKKLIYSLATLFHKNKKKHEKLIKRLMSLYILTNFIEVNSVITSTYILLSKMIQWLLYEHYSFLYTHKHTIIMLRLFHIIYMFLLVHLFHSKHQARRIFRYIYITY